MLGTELVDESVNSPSGRFAMQRVSSCWGDGFLLGETNGNYDVLFIHHLADLQDLISLLTQIAKDNDHVSVTQ